jgi:hypothetical protein
MISKQVWLNKNGPFRFHKQRRMNKFQEARPTRQLTQAGHFLPFFSLRPSSIYVSATILPIFADE